MKNKQDNIPALRFREFSGAWEVKKLEEVISFQAGFAFKSSQMLKNQGRYQILKMSSVYLNELRLDRNPSFWDNLTIKNKKALLYKGDTVLTLTGTVNKRDYGYSILITENNKYLLNQRLVRLREIKNKTHNPFIKELVSLNQFLNHFFSVSKGGTGNQSNVSIQDVKNIMLAIPPLPEQKKIAQFLTTLDKRLQQLRSKKTLLQTYKKGCLQQLFTQQLRFKADNGEDFGDWEEKKLGELSIRIGDGLHGTPKYNIKGDYYFINGNNLINGKIVVNEKTKKVAQKEFDKNKRPLGEKTILLSINGTIGNLAFYNNENIVLGKSACYININDEIEKQYCFQLLQSPKIVRYFYSALTGTTIKNLSLATIRATKINLPTLPEQKKIAHFLTHLDTQISTVSQQLEQLEGFKRGILQRMFV